jgi:hypothetical protein
MQMTGAASPRAVYDIYDRRTLARPILVVAWGDNSYG